MACCGGMCVGALCAAPALWSKVTAASMATKKALAMALLPLALLAVGLYARRCPHTAHARGQPYVSPRRRAAPRRFMKPEALDCVNECPQTRNMALGFAALWLLACKVGPLPP